MSMWRGNIVCDGCGGHVPDGSLMEGIQVVALILDWEVVILNFCLRDDEHHQRCAVTTLTPDALAYYVAERAGHTVPDLYVPEVDDPVEPSMEPDEGT